MSSALKYIGGVLILLALGIVLWRMSTSEEMPAPVAEEEVVLETVSPQSVIGTSVEGRSIEAYTYGEGSTHLLFVGGIHGGYEWNSVLLAYELIDYLEAYPEVLPETLTVTVIPALNPDGLYAVTKKEGQFVASDVTGDTTVGRFNANAVDLNRNFDCKWQPESTWRSQPVSAGTKAFSEPEAQALRDFVLEQSPTAVVFWHSKANAVYASECLEGVLPETLTLMNTYATAAKYRAVPSFDAYPVTGDAEGWLASLGIPAITVELRTHETIEWEQNRAAIRALFSLYGE